MTSTDETFKKIKDQVFSSVSSGFNEVTTQTKVAVNYLNGIFRAFGGGRL